MKVKVRNILFVLLILVYCMTSSDTGNNSTYMKYGVLFLAIGYEGYIFFKKKNKKRMMEEYRYLGIFVLILMLYSILKSVLSMHFSFRSIQEFIFLITPMLYGCLVINNWSKRDINKNFEIGLIISFLCYIFSLGLSITQVINAMVRSSFGDSFSELESFTYCGLAIAFCLYFCYYGYKNTSYQIISVLFVIMTFKRMFMVIAIVLFLLSKFSCRNNKVTRKWVIAIIVCLMLFGILYYFAMQPQNVVYLDMKYNINISKLTSTRSDRMRMLLYSGYSTYGFGSSTEFMYKYFGGALEMDFPKIVVELGFVPALMLIYSYINFAKANTYTFFFMVMMVLNLIMSSGLTGTFAWCIIFITISCITIYPENENTIRFRSKER